MLNRHGLVAGATGTGKTKTLQSLAEQPSPPPAYRSSSPTSRATSPDWARPAPRPTASSRSAARRTSGRKWSPTSFPVEYLTLGGAGRRELAYPGHDDVLSFGPSPALSKVLGLNETQESLLWR